MNKQILKCVSLCFPEQIGKCVHNIYLFSKRICTFNGCISKFNCIYVCATDMSAPAMLFCRQTSRNASLHIGTQLRWVYMLLLTYWGQVQLRALTS